MKRPDYQEKTEVKVIDKERIGYGQRGTVVRLGVTIDGGPTLDPAADKEKVKQAYADGLEPKMEWSALVKFKDGDECWFGADELEPVQHKFVDIDYIREDDLVIGKKEDGTDAVRPKNTSAFEPGDEIQITTKVDGANASISWDKTTSKWEIFSRTNLLDKPGSLRGFYDYIKTTFIPKLPVVDERSCIADFVIFGEWLVSHTVKYNKEVYNKWYVYDIWDRRSGCYMTQDFVAHFCETWGLDYVETLYYGPFISWDHCRSFLRASKAYGADQEGIVIKNQSKLWNKESRQPIYIKIVNEEFKEHMANKGHKQKEVDPVKEAEKKRAEELIASVVTEARVKKHILKLVDEGILPESLEPKDIGTCMKELPKRIFEDILKEEPEVVKQAGEHAGKCCSAQTAALVRKVILGN